MKQKIPIRGSKEWGTQGFTYGSPFPVMGEKKKIMPPLGYPANPYLNNTNFSGSFIHKSETDSSLLQCLQFPRNDDDG